MKTFMFEQYSEAWCRERAGIPTASQFHRIMTPAKRQYSSQAREYARELFAEKQLGYARASSRFSPTEDMQRGIELEPEARGYYEIEYGEKVQQVGFCLTDCGRFGCSPDGLIVGKKRGLELKVPRLDTHLGYLDEGILPREYACQVHGSLIVTGYDEWDFYSYSDAEGVPSLHVRVTPDETTEALRKCLERFAAEYAEVRAKLGVRAA